MPTREFLDFSLFYSVIRNCQSICCHPLHRSSHAHVTCSRHTRTSHAHVTRSRHTLTSHAHVTCARHMRTSHAHVTCARHMLTSHTRHCVKSACVLTCHANICIETLRARLCHTRWVRISTPICVWHRVSCVISAMETKQKFPISHFTLIMDNMVFTSKTKPTKNSLNKA